MYPLVIRRLFIGLATLLTISVMVFIATEILPGDVASAILGQAATEESKAILRDQLGLNEPVVLRFFSWFARVLTGDFGISLASGQPVASLIWPRLQNTVFLAFVTTVIAVPLAVILGIVAAAYPNKLLDKSLAVGTLTIVSVPEYFVGIIAVMVFAIYWRLFPATIYTIDLSNIPAALYALTLPVLTLVAAVLAHIVRMTRSAMIDVLKSAYIEMALLKGLTKWRILLGHALPNAYGPIANVVALNLGYLISGVVVIEVTFTYPGLGRLMVDSAGNRDIPVVQATALIFCTAYILLNLLADLISIGTNPRLRNS